MRILYLSQYFPPEMGAPAARVFELSRAWVRAGHQVQVLTGFPNHPTGVVAKGYRGQLFRREQVEGIEVLRTPIYAAPNRDVLRRSANYLSFALSAAVLGPLRVRRPQVIVATSPQVLTGLAGLWLARVLRCPWVLEVRDLWPASIVAVGALPPDGAAVKALELLERTLYREADRIVAVTDGFVEAIAARGGGREKIAVIKNGVDLELFSPGQPDPRRRARLGLAALEGKFVATYVGTHGMAHGLGTILGAAAQLRGEDRFRFLLVGEGAEKAQLQARARAEGLDNVTFLDQQPRERIPDLLRASDVCLALLRDRPLFRTVLPSKIFEFLGCARPVILGVQGEAAALLADSGGGVTFPPEDAAALVVRLRQLEGNPLARLSMGLAGRRYVEAHFSRTALAEAYLKVLGALVAER